MSRIRVRLTLLAILLLGVTPPLSAGPAGVNLTWDDCLLGGGKQTLTNACTPGADSMRTLILSVEVAEPITKIHGAQGYIEFWFDSGGIPDFWRFDDAGCRAGSITTDPHVGATSPPFSCAEPWSAQPGVLSALQFNAYYQCNNRARMIWIVALPEGLTEIDPAVSSEWYLMKFSMAAGGLGCLGCDVPVCMYPVQTRIIREAGSLGGDYFVEAPGSSYEARWQHSSFSCVGTDGGGLSCPTSTTRSTWGQVKQMYR